MMEGKVMKSYNMLVVAGVLALSAIPAFAQSDIQNDRKDIHQGTQQELNTKQDLRQDKSTMRQDEKAGNGQAAQAERKDIHSDTQQSLAQKKDLRTHKSDMRSDVKAKREEKKTQQ
jgi:outer membrane murein-binding lipoprotein Lpp